MIGFGGTNNTSAMNFELDDNNFRSSKNRRIFHIIERAIYL
jgi:hypothetical protein